MAGYSQAYCESPSAQSVADARGNHNREVTLSCYNLPCVHIQWLHILRTVRFLRNGLLSKPATLGTSPKNPIDPEGASTPKNDAPDTESKDDRLDILRIPFTTELCGRL